MSFLNSILARPLVGLDIGVSGIKAVELAGSKAPRLYAYNRIPLPLNAVSPEGEFKDREVVVKSLKKLFETKQFSSKKVCVGASGSAIITKRVTLPKMSADELTNQLYWEAEQYIPFNITEVNLDFVILGNSAKNQTGQPNMDVLLVAGKKDYISNLTSLITEAGLIPEIVDNQAFALGNAFEFNYGHLAEESTGHPMDLIIDFGAGSTKLSVVEGDKTTFTRDIRQSGLGCTQLISERLGMPIEDAENLKLSEGYKDPCRSVIHDYVHTWVEEIGRTVDFSVPQSAEQPIRGIFICGGASRTEGLKPLLEKRLNCGVKDLNPVQNVAGSGRKMNAQAIREISYLGAVAIGLSLRMAGDAA